MTKTVTISTPRCRVSFIRYYLLLKKYHAGKLEPEEIEMMQDTSPSKSKSPEKLAQNFGSNQSFLHNTGSSSYYRGNSGSRDRDSKTERESKTDRGLPVLNPQLNIGDINYSFKEKISINTAPNKNMTATSQNFSSYKRGPKEELSQQMNIKPPSRDPKYDFKKPSERSGSGYRQTGENSGSGYARMHHTATKSFDFNKPQKAFTASTAQYRTQGVNDIYAREGRKSTSNDSEPKSRKLLELMLKRISKINTEDESPLTQARSLSKTTAQHSKNWDTKSMSMDQNKKKLHLTMTRQNEQVNQSYSRKSSRDSNKVFNAGTGSSTAFPGKAVMSLNKSKPIQIRSLRMRNQGTG